MYKHTHRGVFVATCYTEGKIWCICASIIRQNSGSVIIGHHQIYGRHKDHVINQELDNINKQHPNATKEASFSDFLSTAIGYLSASVTSAKRP